MLPSKRRQSQKLSGDKNVFNYVQIQQHDNRVNLGFKGKSNQRLHTLE